MQLWYIFKTYFKSLSFHLTKKVVKLFHLFFFLCLTQNLFSVYILYSLPQRFRDIERIYETSCWQFFNGFMNMQEQFKRVPFYHLIKKFKTKFLQHSIIRKLRIRHFINSSDFSLYLNLTVSLQRWIYSTQFRFGVFSQILIREIRDLNSWNDIVIFSITAA